MKYVTLSDTLKLPKVIAGCMRIKDAGLTPDELMRFVEGCIDMGVDAFDHAPVYGLYTCEEYFGDSVLKKNPALRSKMKLITKTGIMLPEKKGHTHIYYDSSEEYILAEVERSLKKLGTDYVDLLLIHRPDPMAHPAETARVLEKVVKEGKVLHLGVSNYTPAQVAALQSYLSIPLVTNQIELSAKNTEHFFDGSVDDAFTRRMSLMAWSPLGGGSIFTGEDEASVRIKNRLAAIAKERNTSIDVLLYAWLFNHPAEIMALTGSFQMERVKAAVDALDIDMTRDEWYAILEASRGYAVP